MSGKISQDFDVVSKPSHYASGGIECKDAMKAMMEGVSVSPYVAGWWMQAVQYLWRWPNKNGIQDLEKAKQCIDFMLDELAGLRSHLNSEYSVDDYFEKYPNNWKSWSDDDIQKIVEMKGRDFTNQEIAEALGRSIGALNSFMKRLREQGLRF